MRDHLNEYNECHSEQLSSKNLKEAVFLAMEDEEEEIERNINNITCNTSFQSPVAMNVKNKYENMSLERQLASGILSEMIVIFKGCTIQSTIRDSIQSDSDKHFDKINDSE